jgi:hypothetical protein
MGEPIREIPHEFKWMACRRAQLKRSLIENRIAVSISALFSQRPGEAAD